MIELKPTNLHWLNDVNPFEDLCAHGGVYLNINGFVVSDGEDFDWSVSTASYYLLKTVWSDYEANSDVRHLIPHCGHCMYKAEGEEDSLYISECSNGINWEISHTDEAVIHRFADETSTETSCGEWSRAVCAFSREVLDFFNAASPKICEDKDEREGFELFMQQWLERLARACEN
jgi:hypothetical protein